MGSIGAGLLHLVHNRLSYIGLAVAAGVGTAIRVSAPGTTAAVSADVEALIGAGLAVGSGYALLESGSAEALERWLTDALDATEHNPLPEFEWVVARRTLHDDLLVELAGISLQSVRRYASGTRPTPDDVAARLHFIALVNADLAGSYNDFGIRRWWRRPRAQLGTRSPSATLGPGFDPDSSDAARVRELAAALTGAGAAT